MKRVFLVHGWAAKPGSHWFPWLTHELEANYIKVFAPTMPHADKPELAEWLDMLSSWVGKPDEDTHFVGHSLGSLTIVRYVESLPPEARVGKCFLVGGFKDDIGFPELSGFTERPVDFVRVKSHGARFVSILSDNDRTVPMAASLSLAHALDAKTEILRGKGHFCSGDGVLSMPEILSELVS